VSLWRRVDENGHPVSSSNYEMPGEIFPVSS